MMNASVSLPALAAILCFTATTPAPLGVSDADMPATAQNVWRAIQKARK